MTAEHHLIQMKLLSVMFCFEAPHISQTRWPCSPVMRHSLRASSSPYQNLQLTLALTGPLASDFHLCLAPQRCLPAIPSSLGPDMPQWPYLLRLHHHVSSSAGEWLRGNPRDLLGSSLPCHPGPAWVTARFLSCVPPQASAHCLCRVSTQSESMKIYN